MGVVLRTGHGVVGACRMVVAGLALAAIHRGFRIIP
jgi:hypothetical protein